MPAKVRRRRFTAAYKLRILGQADRSAPRGVAALLRREGLHRSQLIAWRRARDRGDFDEPRAERLPRAGRRWELEPAAPDATAKHLASLDLQVVKLASRVERVEALVELQVKMAGLLGGSVARLLPPPGGVRDKTVPGALAAQERRAELRTKLVAHLQETRGNVTEVARRLGRARPVVHRWLTRFDIDPGIYRG